jgi:hypothetical protein
MDLLRKTKDTFNNEFEKLARANIVRKLEKQGIDYRELDSSDFNELVADEIKILESDTKKVGAGIAIGIVASMLLGF